MRHRKVRCPRWEVAALEPRQPERYLRRDGDLSQGSSCEVTLVEQTAGHLALRGLSGLPVVLLYWFSLFVLPMLKCWVPIWDNLWKNAVSVYIKWSNLCMRTLCLNGTLFVLEGEAAHLGEIVHFMNVANLTCVNTYLTGAATR